MLRARGRTQVGTIAGVAFRALLRPAGDAEVDLISSNGGAPRGAPAGGGCVHRLVGPRPRAVPGDRVEVPTAVTRQAAWVARGHW